MDAPPPPPPPHGANARQKASDLPNGQYDIFVIPPHSSGSGFLYLPSLQTQRNSFLAGVACTTVAFVIWFAIVPVIKQWFKDLFHGGGPGILVLVIGVGVGAWAWGKTQAENGQFPGFGTGGTPSAGAGAGSTGPQPNGTAGAPPRSSWQRPNASTTGGTKPAASGTARTNWEKAREETRKKEEERRKADEAKKKREEVEKEKQKQREKDAAEREAREKKEAQEREAREKKRPPPPTARTEAEDDAYSFRPYDKPKRPVHKANSAASMYSEASYAQSHTTARTTPPPSNRGPYMTKDPDKIIIKAVYSFNNTFMQRPIAQLISGQGNVTDGLILRITTEGLFIDDDVRGVPQREWDVKAWTLKLAEVWCPHLKATHFGSTPRNPDSFRKHQRLPSNAESDELLEKFAITCLFHCDPITQARTEHAVPGAFPTSPSRLKAVSQPEKTKVSSSTDEDKPSLCPDDSASNAGSKSFEKARPPSFTSSRPSSPISVPSSSHSSLSSSTATTLKPKPPSSLKPTFNIRKQSGELNGLHVLRASIRDQEGKRYVFVLEQTEGWKVAVGLQRLRRGTQVRALAVAGLPMNETKHYLETLGWL